MTKEEEITNMRKTKKKERRNSRTYIHRHITQLRPAHGMVQVVLAKVVFGQVGDVGELDVGNVLGSKDADIHFWPPFFSSSFRNFLFFLFVFFCYYLFFASSFQFPALSIRHLYSRVNPPSCTRLVPECLEKEKKKTKNKSCTSRVALASNGDGGKGVGAGARGTKAKLGESSDGRRALCKLECGVGD